MGTPNAVTTIRRLSPVLALALVATACGGTSSSAGESHTAASTKSAAATSSNTTTTTISTAAAVVHPHLRILAPRAGARSGETLTVRLALSGAPARGDAFRYVLDGKLTRRGARRLTYHDLLPGRHHLRVSLLANGSVHESTVFLVPAPPPPPQPMAPAPTTATMAAPAPTTMAPAPMAPSGSGIPQGGGGDHDGDNSGGPSDGDGNA